jgi:cytochrome P450
MPEEIEGLRIARGTLVMISPWVLHRHSLHWSNPNAFDPERFLPDAAPRRDLHTCHLAQVLESA